MACVPHNADMDRTVKAAFPVDTTGNWWTGLVHDYDPTHNQERLRLERWVHDSNGYHCPHTWRIRPEFWPTERNAAQTLDNNPGNGDSPPGSLPISQRLTPQKYTLIRKDDTRWVAAVRISRPYKSDCVRLYHWTPSGKTRQKWTVGKDWHRISKLATRIEI